MIKLDERKITQTTSGGRLLALPVWWCKNNGVVGGSYVQVSVDGKGRLVIEPKQPDSAK